MFVKYIPREHEGKNNGGDKWTALSSPLFTEYTESGILMEGHGLILIAKIRLQFLW